MKHAHANHAGWGHRSGNDHQHGFARGDRCRTDDDTTTQTTPQVTTDTYSDEAVAELLFMIEEEKLAGDVYESFYDLYGVRIFNNIAHSEDRHFDALVRQAEAMDLDISDILDNDAGTFENAELQTMYDNLIATGNESLEAALEVGVTIEEKDIVDIAAASDSVEGTTLAYVYDHLLEGSNHHLDAFENALNYY